MRSPFRAHPNSSWTVDQSRVPFSYEDEYYPSDRRSGPFAGLRETWENFTDHSLLGDYLKGRKAPQYDRNLAELPPVRPAEVADPEAQQFDSLQKRSPAPPMASITSSRKERLRSFFDNASDIVPSLAYSEKWDGFRKGIRVFALIVCSLITVATLSFFFRAGQLTQQNQAMAAASTRSTTTTTKVQTATRASSSQQSATLFAHPEIAPAVMHDYQQASKRCNLDWSVLAAVGQVESNHGTSTADGVRSGSNFMGAQGPMQFLPSTFAQYGIDGDNNGTVDIYSQSDAIHSAANMLCANGARDTANSRNQAGVDKALYAYNPDRAYVTNVKDRAKAILAGSFAYPLPENTIEAVRNAETHHTYPAIDVVIPSGTPVFAVAKGTIARTDGGNCGRGVIIEDARGVSYTYCHLESTSVSSNAEIAPGQLLGRSGGEPGTSGAGRTTGPHLHLEVSMENQSRCPQRLLTDWYRGIATDPRTAPTSGCVRS